MARLLTRRVFRETQLLMQRNARDLPRPVMIEFSQGQVSVWLKGTHERFTLTFEELFDFARRRRQEPLITLAELRDADRRRQLEAIAQ